MIGADIQSSKQVGVPRLRLGGSVRRAPQYGTRLTTLASSSLGGMTHGVHKMEEGSTQRYKEGLTARNSGGFDFQCSQEKHTR